MSMKCKKVLAVSVIFSLFMANIAYAANPKVEIAYRGSVEDGLEIKYDDGTVKYADDNVMLMSDTEGNDIAVSKTELDVFLKIVDKLFENAGDTYHQDSYDT